MEPILQAELFSCRHSIVCYAVFVMYGKRRRFLYYARFRCFLRMEFVIINSTTATAAYTAAMDESSSA